MNAPLFSREAGTRRGAWLPALAAAALALAVYANALANGYAIDDAAIVQNNDVIHTLSDPGRLLLGPYWPHDTELYRPLTLLTFALQWALWGDTPAAFHAVNVIGHAGATVLVCFLLLRLGAPRAGAFAGAAVFAVHPVHVEAVASVVGWAEVLSTLFFLAACHVYLARPRAGAGRVAAVALLYLLALGAKEIAVTLPAVLLLLDAFRARGEEGVTPLGVFRRNLPLLGALTLALLAFLALRANALGSAVGTEPAPYFIGVPTVERWATAVRLWPEYLRLLLWPADLSAEWGPDVIEPVGWTHPRTLLGVLVGIGLAAAAWVSWKRDRWVAVAILWVALTLFPVSHLPFPVGVMIAERTLYLPSAGVAFLAPPLVALALRERERTRRLVAALFVLVLVGAAARTWTRTPVWKSTEAVFDALVEEHPTLWWVEWRAAQLLTQAGRPLEALPWYRKALVKARYNHYRMNLDYAMLLMDLGRLDEAEPLVRRAAGNSPQKAPAWVILSALEFDRGRYREAVAAAERAKHVPRMAASAVERAEHRQALAYDALGMLDSALVVRLSSLKGADTRVRSAPWFHLARLYTLRGQEREARAALDSTHARVSPSLRPAFTLDPLPPVTDTRVRGWGTMAPGAFRLPRPAGAPAADAGPGDPGAVAPEAIP